MHLEHLELRSAPGVTRQISLDHLAAELVIIVGPNASGKSTLARAILSTLWPELASAGLDVVSQWKIEGRAHLEKASLRHRQVEWSGDVPSFKPEASRAWRLSIADLIQANDQSDQEIAHQIQVQLAGGHDLPALKEVFAPTRRPARKLTQALKDAEQQCQRLLNDQEDLARQENELDQLQAKSDAAFAANEKQQGAERALQLAQARQDLALVEERLAAFPSGHQTFRKALVEQIKEGKDRQQKERDAGSRLSEQINALQTELSTTEYTAAPTAAPTVSDQKAALARAQQFGKTLEHLDKAQENRAVSEAALAQAKLQVFQPGAAVEPHSLAQKLEALQQAVLGVNAATTTEKAAAQQEQVAAALQQQFLTDHPRPPNAAALDAAIKALRGWLQQPSSDATTETLTQSTFVFRGWPWALVVIGVAVAVGGLLLTNTALTNTAVVAVGTLLLGLGLGLVLGSWRARFADKNSSTQDDARAQIYVEMFQKTKLEGPKHWKREAVETLLDSLNETADRAHQAARLNAGLDAARLSLNRAREALEREEQALNALLDQSGLVTELGSVTLLQQAHRIGALADAQSQLAQAQASATHLSNMVAEQRGSLSSWLSNFEGSIVEVSDGHAAIAMVQAVMDRCAHALGLTKNIKDLETRLVETNARLDEVTTTLERLYQEAGVAFDDDAAVLILANQHDEWMALSTQRTLHSEQIVRGEQALAGNPNLLQVSIDDAQQEIDTYKRLAGTQQEAADAVAKIEQRIQSVSNGTSLQDANEKRATAQIELATARDEMAVTAAAQELLCYLEEKVASEHMPKVFERARRRFGRFTHGRYQLNLNGDDGFVATDGEDNRQRNLSELSDGTRIQLLLSVRLAFLEHVEAGGPKLPLFLDEVLSTTDPVRFASIGECLLELTEDGRQILYATADKSEAAAWQELCRNKNRKAPRIVWLDAPGSERWADDLPTAPRGPAELSGLNLQDSLAYLKQTATSRPTARQPATAWPLALLLYDDLPAAEACRQASLRSAGQLVTLFEQGNVPLPVDDNTCERVRGRLQLLKETLRLFAIGRGQPIPWEMIEASGAVSAKFEDPVRALHDACGDNPLAFMKAVRDLKGFRSPQREKLQKHLSSAGLLEQRPQLNLEVIIERAITRVSPAISAGHLKLEETAPFVRWVLQLLASPKAPR